MIKALMWLKMVFFVETCDTGSVECGVPTVILEGFVTIAGEVDGL
jgi:hypothetical protein